MGEATEPVLAVASFRPTVDDIAAARRCYLRWRFTRPTAALWLFVYGMIGVVAASTGGPRPPLWVLAVTFLLCASIAIALSALVYAGVPLTSRRLFRAQKNLQHEWRVELTASGLRASTPAQTSRVAWSEYVGWSETPKVILVCQSDALYQLIPKRAADAHFLAIFHERVAGLPRR